MSNITIDDTSPQVVFTSKSYGWTTNHTGDDSTQYYFDDTFHTTYTNGDAMTYKFNGTAVYVYGAKRQNHGAYSVQLDGGDTLFLVGYGYNPETFQALIYSAGGLSPDKEHTVILTNLPSETNPPGNATVHWYLDIDYIVVTTADTGKVYTTIYDDSSSAFSYSGGWVVNNGSVFGYYNATNHITYNVGSTVTFEFSGSSVELLAGINYDHGEYSVTLDGGVPDVFNGSSYTLFYNTTLYVANNLTDGPHQVVISNLGGGTQGTGAALDFDSAVVNSSTTPVLANTTGVNGTISTNVTSSGNASAASTSLTTAKPPSKGTNVGAIAGGVVGGVAALLILGGLLWFFFFRRKHQYKQARRDPVDLNGDANQPDHDGGEVEPFPNSRSGYGSTSPAANSNEYGSGPYANSSSENASSPGANQSSGREMSQHGPPILTAIPPPPASNATSYPRSPVTRSASGQQGYDDDRLSRTASNDSFRQRSSGPASSGSAPSTGLAPPISSSLPPNSSTTVKAAGVALPFTARVPNAPPPRMNVRGREQDMGPIPFSEDGHGSDEGALPPDYQQATEPLPGQGPRPEDSL